MMTPIVALSLGAMLNDEPLSINLVLGAFFVLCGLALYQWGGKVIRRKVAPPQT